MDLREICKMLHMADTDYLPSFGPALSAAKLLYYYVRGLTFSARIGAGTSYKKIHLKD